MDTPADGLLILIDSYYSGWEAKLDGKQQPLYRVNHALSGVFVHEVQFRFRPTFLRAAVFLAALSVLVAAISTGISRRIEQQTR